MNYYFSFVQMFVSLFCLGHVLLGDLLHEQQLHVGQLGPDIIHSLHY